MAGTPRLDAIDHKILEQLQRDARQPMEKLAGRVGLSAPACYRRVRRLRETGTILRETAIVDPRAMGWNLSMIVLVALEREDVRTADNLMRRLEAEPQVTEAAQITGEHDFAVRIIARSMEDYDMLTRRLFVEDEHVRSFETLVIYRQSNKARIFPPA
ncbi:Lrp/AsnC family transcriptional regulator [Altericroceibacterium spongiae]|uniref:Lrp/AsnC family transcriptional regulator n=1 Tax=Altericroceibacterium spongiae TaxID=2320269 RepID=A0A420EBX4_9SPHN|nr:Lrp/AsnC family transcriptional regulator [Altericroceibacterium spongiae]RKF18197.1 Lrp/AsnC family transcriptional regulator [Altericroceibacterium spongiae]